jgi:hypothetical protein
VTATNEIASYAVAALALVPAIAFGASTIERRHSGTPPARLGRYSGSVLGWRWVLRREHRGARERELQLLSYA